MQNVSTNGGFDRNTNMISIVKMILMLQWHLCMYSKLYVSFLTPDAHALRLRYSLFGRSFVSSVEAGVPWMMSVFVLCFLFGEVVWHLI